MAVLIIHLVELTAYDISFPELQRGRSGNDGKSAGQRAQITVL
jgi:hypothetical protein